METRKGEKGKGDDERGEGGRRGKETRKGKEGKGD